MVPVWCAADRCRRYALRFTAPVGAVCGEGKIVVRRGLWCEEDCVRRGWWSGEDCDEERIVVWCIYAYWTQF